MYVSQFLVCVCVWGVGGGGAMLVYLIQMHQEGHVAPQVGGQFAVFSGQQKSFWTSIGTLLLSGRVHFFNTFSAVVQHHFTVPLERNKI